MRYRQTEKVELQRVPIFSPKYRELRPKTVEITLIILTRAIYNFHMVRRAAIRLQLVPVAVRLVLHLHSCSKTSAARRSEEIDRTMIPPKMLATGFMEITYLQ